MGGGGRGGYAAFSRLGCLLPAPCSPRRPPAFTSTCPLQRTAKARPHAPVAPQRHPARRRRRRGVGRGLIGAHCPQDTGPPVSDPRPATGLPPPLSDPPVLANAPRTERRGVREHGAYHPAPLPSAVSRFSRTVRPCFHRSPPPPLFEGDRQRGTTLSHSLRLTRLLHTCETAPPHTTSPLTGLLRQQQQPQRCRQGEHQGGPTARRPRAEAVSPSATRTPGRPARRQPMLPAYRHPGRAAFAGRFVCAAGRRGVLRCIS